MKRKLRDHLLMMESNLRQYSIVREDWMQKEWLQQEELPEDVLDKQVEEAYKKSHDGQKIGFFEKPKAKKEFKKKFKVQAQAVKAYEKYHYDAQNDISDEKESFEKIEFKNNQGSLGRDIRNLSLILDTKEERNELVRKLADAHKHVDTEGMSEEEQESAGSVSDQQSDM